MTVNAIEGIIENGKVRLRDDVSLPENTKVYVIVADQPNRQVAHMRSPRLANAKQAGDFRKQIVELPPDAK